jgi:hypothetical protein
MHPEIAKTLVKQHHQELARPTAVSRREIKDSAGPGWLSRHLPRWHVSWSRTILSPATEHGPAGNGRPGRSGRRGSALVIIISAHRSA